MSSISDYHKRDRLAELWRKIENTHLSYLEFDDGTEKLDRRKKLEGYILEYLSIVPHELKFGLSETTEVMKQSINDPNYSAYKVGLGFAALARYAANLLTQPWRKEYRTIKTYCGYYKHEVQSNLSLPELILDKMGYKSMGNSTYALDGPICPDTVTAVSRDALIAYVDCQIMYEEWLAAWSSGDNISFKELAKRRELAMDRYDQKKVYMNHRKQQSLSIPESQHYESQGNNSSVSQYRQHTTIPAHFNGQNIRNNYNQYRNTEQYVMGANGYYCDPYRFPQSCYPQMMGPSIQPYMVPPPIYGCRYYQPNIIPTCSSQTVPIGQLIDIEYDSKRSPKMIDSKSQDVTDSRSDIISSGMSRSDSQPLISKVKDEIAGTYESWDYVFRNLEAQERERSGLPPLKDSKTLNRHREKNPSKYQPMTLDLEDGMRAINLDRSRDEEVNRIARVNETLMKLRQSEERRKQRKKVTEENRRLEEVRKAEEAKRISLEEQKRHKEIKMLEEIQRSEVRRVEDALRSEEFRRLEERRIIEEEARKSLSNEASRCRTLVNGSGDGRTLKSTNGVRNWAVDDSSSHLTSGNSNGNSSLKKTKESRKSQQQVSNGDQSSNTKKGKWNCGTCTFINVPSVKVCVICGKSRNYDGDCATLHSGGRQCPTCTLVNPSESVQCEVCNTSLQHSPTYI